MAMILSDNSNKTQSSPYLSNENFTASNLIVTPCNKILVKDNFSHRHGYNYRISLDANGKDLCTKSCEYGKTTTFDLDELNIQKNLQFKLIARFETPMQCSEPPDYVIPGSIFPNYEGIFDFDEPSIAAPFFVDYYSVKSNFILIYTDNIDALITFELTSNFELKVL